MELLLPVPSCHQQEHHHPRLLRALSLQSAIALRPQRRFSALALEIAEWYLAGASI